MRTGTAVRGLSGLLWVWLAGLGGAGAWPGRADAPPLPAPASLSAAVPFSLSALGQILLPVQSTGTQGRSAQGEFVLDTGMQNCLVAQSLVQSLGLPTQPALGDEGQPIISHGRALRLVSVPLLLVGRLYVRHAVCLVFDDAALAALTGQRVEGVLGENVLASVATLLDFSRKQATFFPHGSLTPPGLAAIGMGGATAIPLAPVPDGGWFTCRVRMETAGKSVVKDLVVDTGCVRSVISQDTSRQLGVGDDGTRRHRRRLLTANGRLPVSDLVLPTLILGGSPSGGVTVRNTEMAAASGPLPGDMAETLGLNVLDEYEVLLDFPGETLYLLH